MFLFQMNRCFEGILDVEVDLWNCSDECGSVARRNVDRSSSGPPRRFQRWFRRLVRWSHFDGIRWFFRFQRISRVTQASSQDPQKCIERIAWITRLRWFERRVLRWFERRLLVIVSTFDREICAKRIAAREVEFDSVEIV